VTGKAARYRKHPLERFATRHDLDIARAALWDFSPSVYIFAIVRHYEPFEITSRANHLESVRARESVPRR
jgi:hypothetical protein